MRPATKSLGEYYNGRRAERMLVGRNAGWANTLTHGDGQFACPIARGAASAPEARG